MIYKIAQNGSLTEYDKETSKKILNKTNKQEIKEYKNNNIEVNLMIQKKNNKNNYNDQINKKK